MQIRYVLGLKKPIVVEDHWPIPFMNGQLLMLVDGDRMTGLEIVLPKQPIHYAPKVSRNASTGYITITSGDDLFPLIRIQLESAFAFLQCYFDVEIAIDEIEVHFNAETEEENGLIDLPSLKIDKADRPLRLSFDFFTRALMAAETHAGPQFEATLVLAARHALAQNKHIDSFRYSFLLIEALFGEGKFKTSQLKAALRANPAFVAMVATALKQKLPIKKPTGSDTEKLLASGTTPGSVIDHLVDKRGFYFHGNPSVDVRQTPQPIV